MKLSKFLDKQETLLRCLKNTEREKNSEYSQGYTEGQIDLIGKIRLVIKKNDKKWWRFWK